MSGPSTVERLRDAGERVTRQRLQVADALAAEGRQVTAGELWQRMRRRDRRIGRATVFRTLEALVAAAPDLIVVESTDEDAPSIAGDLLRHPALTRGGARFLQIPMKLWACPDPALVDAAVLIEGSMP